MKFPDKDKALADTFAKSATTMVGGVFTGAIVAAAMLGVSGMNQNLFKKIPYTETELRDIAEDVMKDKLDPREFGSAQQAAAHPYIRAGIIADSGVSAEAIEKRRKSEVMQQITARIDSIMAEPEFAQLMNEHSALWREQQRVLHGQQVASALQGAHGQVKAPQRASFSRSRQAVSA